MVLGGRVNKSLVSLIEQAGGHAIGLSGKDGGLLKARQVGAHHPNWANWAEWALPVDLWESA